MPTLLPPLVLSLLFSATSGAGAVEKEPSPMSTQVLVGPRSVDIQTGQVVHQVSGVDTSQNARPAPNRPGWFRLGALEVEAATGKTTPLPSEPLQFVGNQLEHVDASGKVLWSVEVPGFASVRPPDMVVISNRAIVYRNGKLFAYDLGTGQLIWSQPDPMSRLISWGQRIVGIGCVSEKDGSVCSVVARNASDGKEVLKTPLPKDANPDKLEAFEGRVWVHDSSHHYSWLIDETGVVRARLETILALHELADGWLAMSEKRWLRLDRNGSVRWERKGPPNIFVGAGGFVELTAGEVVAFNYGAISDSGVELVRLNLATGEESWRVGCAPLGVAHSEYFHEAYVLARDNELVVVSQGSSGAFVEVRDLRKGEKLRRFEFRQW
jgi:outer membrane protein assembly factor BamB